MSTLAGRGTREPLLSVDGLPALRAGSLTAQLGDAGTSESLDYETPINSVFLVKQQDARALQRRRLYGYSGSTATKLAATLVSGLLIGLSAAAMQGAAEVAEHRRNALLDWLLHNSPAAGGSAPLQRLLTRLQGLPLAWLAAVGVSMAAVWGATLAVACWAPRAAGGGVALVMALLNGNAIHGLLSRRVYLVKMLGTPASRLAGLALGMEGPMVHIGACLASIVCHAEHSLYRRLNLHRRAAAAGKLQAAAAAAAAAPEDFLFSNADHRELVSAGAAAGLAAAFGAPIGGVLFALEEATSVWSRKLAWRCFLCASVACFTLAQLHPRSQSGMLSLRGTNPLTNLEWLVQLPLLVLVSALGALLGALFNLGKRRCMSWRRRHPGVAWRLAEGAAVAGLTAAALTALPAAAGTCLAVPEGWDAADTVRWNCGEGQYNDLATGLMGSSVWVIRSLLSLGSEAEPVNNQLCSLAVPCYYTVLSLALLMATYLALFLLASNLIVPGGLFMPCILVGSALGVLLGLLALEVLPPWWNVRPGVYALVGATAMLGAVFRSSISLVVIVIEGTRGIDLLFGVITAVIVSNWVAHWLHPDGLYEAELHGGTAPCYYLRQEPPHALRGQTAEGVMASPVVGLAPVERADVVLRALRGTTHNGFPVLAPGKAQAGGPAAPAGPGRASGRMQGLVLRSQLLVLLRHGAFCDERGRYLCSSARHHAAAFEEALALEMQAAAQAGGSGYRTTPSRRGPLGQLGPATSLGIAGEGFPTLDASRGAAALPERDVLDAAAAAAEGELEGGRVAYLNLAPFMNLAPTTVRPHTPADRVHHLFLSLSLRHLCVTDWRCRCLGIITRKDLDHAAGAGWWRATDIAPTPHQSPRAGEGGAYGLGGASPTAGWTHSMLRSLTVPPRRIMSALQAAFSPSPRPSFSPRTGLVLRADSSDAGDGGSVPRRQSPARPGAGSAGDGARALRHSVSEPARVLQGLRHVTFADGNGSGAAAGDDVERQ